MFQFLNIVKLSFCLLITLSCNKQYEIRTFGTAIDLRIDCQKIITLKTQTSFQSLISSINEIACNDSIPVIEIKKKDIIKQIKIYQSCVEGSQCYNRRNLLIIKDEKIHNDKIYELENLEKFIIKHYQNFGKSPYFSQYPEKAMIYITYEKIESHKLSKLLDRITSSFEKLNINTPLVIKLEVNPSFLI